MPLYLNRADVTDFPVDAVVNAANESLLGGGGVDGAIHAAAGPELLEECRLLGGCAPGQAKVTGAYRLPAKYIIHTVGPRWRGGGSGEEEVLRACYRNSLRLAEEKGCETVIFPLISSGVFGYPKREALRVAEDEIRRYLEDSELTVYLSVRGRGVLPAETEFAELISLLGGFAPEPELRRRMAGGPLSKPRTRKPLGPFTPTKASREEDNAADLSGSASRSAPKREKRERPRRGTVQAFRAPEDAPGPEEEMCEPTLAFHSGVPADLERELRELDESFSQMLLRKITEKGMTDAQCYRRANVDRRLFSKIRSDAHYRPSKATALAFAVALELSPEETGELLRKAGFALSRSSTFDVIVDFFITRRNYDVYRINEALFAYDQPLLGNVG